MRGIHPGELVGILSDNPDGLAWPGNARGFSSQRRAEDPCVPCLPALRTALAGADGEIAGPIRSGSAARQAQPASTSKTSPVVLAAPTPSHPAACAMSSGKITSPSAVRSL